MTIIFKTDNEKLRDHVLAALRENYRSLSFETDVADRVFRILTPGLPNVDCGAFARGIEWMFNHPM